MEVKEKYSHWFPPLVGAAAVTFGNTILYKYRKEEVQDWMRKHEMKHVEQYNKYTVAGFLIIYLFWYAIGRANGKDHWGAYLAIPFEIEAVKAESE